MLLSSTAERPLTQGLTATQWVSLLKSDRAAWAMKSLNYYDGLQLEEVAKVLSQTRKDWRQRGFIPRVRNLTAAIVDKSGLLFKDGLPTFEVYENLTDTEPNAEASQRLSDLLHGYNAKELFAGLDAVVRLLKTAVILVQWDSDSKRFFFDVLHRGNCEVMIDPVTRGIEALIYRYSEDPASVGYRVITNDEVIDLEERVGGGGVFVTATNVNTFGFVPAAVFYDTRPPRSGFWVESPTDLVGMNEIVNLHLTDSEFAISWAKRPTLFTNMQFKGADDGPLELVEVPNSPLPRLAAPVSALTGGPGQAVILNSIGVDSPFIDYKGPDPKLNELEQVVETWVRAFASDWSVRLEAAGTARASSGFQLVVEEMDNLELREQRAEQFEAGFRRLYVVLAKVLEVLASPVRLNPFAYVDIEFEEPSLPLDQKEQEEVWSRRIDEGRATRVDYFVEVKGMTKEEAEAKVAEIDAAQGRPPAPTRTTEVRVI